ncbi:hypothetical protein ABE501_06740 [Comamonas testosteroni]
MKSTGILLAGSGALRAKASLKGVSPAMTAPRLPDNRRERREYIEKESSEGPGQSQGGDASSRPKKQKACHWQALFFSQMAVTGRA